MDRKVLVVDDSRAIRQSICFILEQNGYEVIEAQGGISGLEKLAEEPVSLIIAGINLQDIDGLSFIRKVREISSCRAVPILVLITESQRQAMEHVTAAGAAAWIMKPFSTDKLMDTVKKLCG